MAATMMPTKRDETISQMQGSLSRYSRANDRRMVLRSLKEVKYLMDVPLEPIILADGSITAFEEEVSTERVNLNGVPFRALTSGGHMKSSGLSECLITLRQLCKKLCSMDTVTVDPDELYASLVQRMSRSMASSDAYFKLNPLLGSSDLMVMPTEEKDTIPILMTLYVSSGDVHATIETTNTYGLYRKADVKPKDRYKGSIGGRAWIKVHGVVYERVNLTSGDSVRSLRVKVPETLY